MLLQRHAIKKICAAAATIAVASTITISNAAEYPPLPQYHVDLKQTSVSGVSSGAYFAAQFHIAWSNYFVGAGIFSGGPWGCNLDMYYDFNKIPFNTECMAGPLSDTRVDDIVLRANQKAIEGTIAPIEDTVNDRIFVSYGEGDRTVHATVSQQVVNFYRKLGVPEENLLGKAITADMEDGGAQMGHAIPTDDFGNACGVTTEPPWISNCGYDGAGEMLKHVYGEENLNPKTSKDNLSGKFVYFDQAEFTRQARPDSPEPSALGMDEMGILYVPESCDPELNPDNECKLHVFFHGCEQGYNTQPVDRDSSGFGFGDYINPPAPAAGTTSISFDDWLAGGHWPGAWPRYSFSPLTAIGDTLVKGVGINEWADTNNMIVMYPQWIKTAGNPKGCNDWWGYSTLRGVNDPKYDEKDAPQMKAVQLMIERMLGQEFVDYGQKKALSNIRNALIKAETAQSESDAATAEAEQNLVDVKETDDLDIMHEKLSAIEALTTTSEEQLAIAQEQKVAAEEQKQIIIDLIPEQEDDAADYVADAEALISKIDLVINDISENKADSENISLLIQAEIIKQKIENAVAITNTKAETSKTAVEKCQSAYATIGNAETILEMENAATENNLCVSTAESAANEINTQLDSVNSLIMDLNEISHTDISSYIADAEDQKDLVTENKTSAEQLITDAQSCMDQLNQTIVDKINNTSNTAETNLQEIVSLKDVVTGQLDMINSQLTDAESATDSANAEAAVIAIDSLIIAMEDKIAIAQNIKTTIDELMNIANQSSIHSSISAKITSADNNILNMQNSLSQANTKKGQAEAALFNLLDGEAKDLYNAAQDAQFKAKAAEENINKVKDALQEQLENLNNPNLQKPEIIANAKAEADKLAGFVNDAETALANANNTAEAAKGTAVETSTAQTAAYISKVKDAAISESEAANALYKEVINTAYTLALSEAQTYADNIAASNSLIEAAKEEQANAANASESIAAAKKIEEQQELITQYKDAIESALNLVNDINSAAGIETSGMASVTAEIETLITEAETDLANASENLAEARDSAVTAAETELNNAQKIYENAETLTKIATTPEEVSEAQASLRNAEEILATAESNYAEADSIAQPEGYEPKIPEPQKSSGGGGGSTSPLLIFIFAALACGIKRRKP